MTLIRIGVPFSGLTKVRVKKTGKLEKRKYAVYQCYCGKRIILLCKQEEVQQSCGCLIKDLRREEQTTHGASYTRVYSIYRGIKQRCLNTESDGYYLYGERGITISDDWMTFENFYRDMGDPPDGMSIDRVDNNLGYSKENCRWATPKEQASNRRTNTYLTIDGITKTMKEWSEEDGAAAYGLICGRVCSGWDHKDAVFVKSKSIGRYDSYKRKQNKGLQS